MTIDTLPRKNDGVRLDETSPSSLDTLFKVFSEPTRREAVVLLRREDDPLSVMDLVDRLDGDADRIRIALVHVHLPLLDRVGIVDWDQARESVEFVDFPDEYDELLNVVERDVQQ
ncbi:hypothetical protein A4G99_13635 [Haladaptatus sp. R4]|uniref:DUF7344 domain-containing protein n=1 Tax=Haladaptatus sp. R4 TaxID=1679489 RepID=UPI0007B4C76B|nr:hypothetical protein [Haladaptatus sp. R4]KZN23876.1 hypothetical protein A4G99_13635 [Haladaptatus sp. R4]